MTNLVSVDVNLAKVISRQMGSIRSWLAAEDFTEIFVPHLTRVKRRPFIPTFGVSSAELNFDGALRASSSYFMAEALSDLKKVYTIATRFRAEPTDGTSHLPEFQLGEIWSAGSFEDFFKTAEGLLSSVIGSLLDKSSSLPVARARELEKIRFPLARVPFNEATKRVGLEPHQDFDFQSALQLVKAHGAPVFVTHPPIEYDPCHTDLRHTSNGTSLGADLLFPYTGEVMTGGELETDEQTLSRQIKRSRFLRELIRIGGTESQLDPYIQALSRLDGPHIKLGFSFERLTQFLIGAEEISNAALFPVSTRRQANGLIIVVIDRIVIIVEDPEPV
jgi:aspartyl/asparaginyl-tRNA synthetase